ncbi:hypothetical protein FOL46_009748 [Perkinsus olseni]|uniref:Intraflagellar transport protein 140 n=1 Tax=Perkinsus olseni TaxID=32597 RepID=A0A7J6MJZ8_PEROL|nr:hypothetical protein FOL46_009748 [Perkinsus olseni]
MSLVTCFPLPDVSTASLSQWTVGDDREALLAVVFEGSSEAEGSEVLLYSVEGVKVPVTPRLHRRSSITSLIWSQLPPGKGGSTLFVAWRDGTLQRVDTTEGVEKKVELVEKRIETEGAHTVTGACSPDGRSLVISSSDGSLTLWDVDGSGKLEIIHRVSSRVGVAAHIVFRTRDPSNPDRSPYVFAAESGSVCSVSSAGTQVESYKIVGPVIYLSYIEEDDIVVILSSTGILARFKMDTAGKMVEDAKMKLSAANPSETRCCWAGSGLLATVSREPFVRLWKLSPSRGDGRNEEEQAHYLMALQDGSEQGAKLSKDVAVSVAYDPNRMVIACGTAKGHVVRWRCLEDDTRDANDASWELLPLIEVPGGNSIDSASWCSRRDASVLAAGVSGPTGGRLLCPWLVIENSILWSSCLPKIAVQTAADRLAVMNSDHGTRRSVQCSGDGSERIHLKGAVLLKAFLVCWSHDAVFVFITTGVEKAKVVARISASSLVAATAWVDDEAKKPALADLTVVVAYPRRLTFLNGSGAQKKEVPYIESTDGAPRALACSASGLLVVVSSTNIIRVWELGRGASTAQPKPVGAPRRINITDKESGEEVGIVESVAANCNGTRASILMSRHERKAGDGGGGGTAVRHQIDARIVFYDIVNDLLAFKYCKASDVLYSPVKLLLIFSQLVARSRRSWTILSRATTSSSLGSFYTFTPTKATRRQGVESSSSISRINALLLFILDDSGSGQIVLQGTHPCRTPSGTAALPVAIATPYIYFYDSSAGSVSKVCQRSFAGMESACDGPQGESTAKALIDFSFYLAKGNADAAYRAVRAVESLAVWENLCRMAVKTRQLQVARRCLGRIQVSGEGSGGGPVSSTPAAALRASFVLRDGDAKADFATDDEELAAIAVHLDMIEEAEELYRQASDYFKLNKLYQRLGRWSDAIAVAEVHDRMHLSSTHFACAKSLEAKGDVEGALKNYEKAGSAGLSEIPRMFLRFGLLQPLKDYVQRVQKPFLYKWYGQYLESTGKAKEAEDYYRQAEDWAALVRLSWARSDLDGARTICRDSGDSNATYQHAKYLQDYCTAPGGVEGKGELLKEVVDGYSYSGRVGAALRLAQTHDMEAELIKLSMQAVYSDEGAGGTATAGAMQAARFYETKGDYARAAALYQKIGQTDKAISLCLATQQYDALRKLADYLSPETTDQATMERCAKVLIEQKYYDKAVQLLASSKQLENAVAMCEDYDVPITEELAEKLTPKDRDHPKYRELLLAIGDLSKQHGLYALACKKFTQAGDKIRAIKALLRSGDTEKIIFYAQTARAKEVYVLAANSLQSLDWFNNPELEKNIIAFYTRAKATDQLSRFHQARAHRAIDEHQDVEGAIAALEEALAAVDKDPDASPTHDCSTMKSGLEVLRKFGEARKSAETDPRTSLVACGSLLQSSELKDSPLRPGDIYAFMAQLFHTNGQTSDAAEVVKRMIHQSITPSVYIPRKLLQEIGFGGLPRESSDA